MKKVTIIGGATGREHAFAKKFKESEDYEISAILWAHNPFVEKLCKNYAIVNLDDINAVHTKVKEFKPDYVLVGQGEVTQRGIRDILDSDGIPCIAPTKEMSKIEGSKSFFRKLLGSLDPSLVPEYMIFTEYNKSVQEFIERKNGDVVVKCDGVISGPRVRVYNQSSNLDEIMKTSEEWINQHGKIVIEDFIQGKEIAIMSFTDGYNLIHSPPFRNHKRVYDGDKGENTSGMGTLTTGETLPFIAKESIIKLQKISDKLLQWVISNHNEKYLGSLYGEFLVNGDDVKVIEYNCRFGNPSSMNLLELMNVNFGTFCESIINGTLNQVNNVWKDVCSLSAYVVPKNFPYSKENVGKAVDLSEVNPDLFLCGNMKFENNVSFLKKSRAFAICATGENISDVRNKVYEELTKVKGPIHYRQDIGEIF